MVGVERVSWLLLRLLAFRATVVKGFVFLIAYDFIFKIGVSELRPSIASQHIDDQHLTPFVDIDQQIAQLAEVLVDKFNTLRADLKF